MTMMSYLWCAFPVDSLLSEMLFIAVLFCMIAIAVQSLSFSTKIHRKTIISGVRLMAGALPTDDNGWRAKLNPNQFAVLRQQATEPPGMATILIHRPTLSKEIYDTTPSILFTVTTTLTYSSSPTRTLTCPSPQVSVRIHRESLNTS